MTPFPNSRYYVCPDHIVMLEFCGDYFHALMSDGSVKACQWYDEDGFYDAYQLCREGYDNYIYGLLSEGYCFLSAENYCVNSMHVCWYDDVLSDLRMSNGRTIKLRKQGEIDAILSLCFGVNKEEKE